MNVADACRAVAKSVLRTVLVVVGLFLCSVGSFALDRNAFTFTSYDLHVRVNPVTHGLSARGTVTLRNDAPAAQRNVSLQISSSLSWNSIQLAGKPLIYVSQPYESDIDHTGAVTEAIVTLPADVAPKQTVTLEISYAGTILPDATRLTRIGMPAAIASRNDWDRISPEFTGVRGAGYVCWYPVAMESVSLSEGDHYFDVLGEWKQRTASALMKVGIEAIGDRSIASNGRLMGTNAHAAVGPDQPGSREADFSFDPIGFYPPSFTVADYSTLSRPSIVISYIGDHRGAAEEFSTAAEGMLPFITDWFGRQRGKIQVIELADPDAAPFDSGSIVFTPLRTADKVQLESSIAHQLAHSCEPPGLMRLWISEGLAHFAQALAREHQSGRKGALEWMDGLLPALQAAEKQAAESPTQTKPGSTNAKDAGQSNAASLNLAAGQPLTRATDPIYYGVKSMFAWWLLRDMVGDVPLQRAIQSYNPAQDKEPGYMQRLVEAQAKRDLEWFFDDWVYRDRGLPDFTIKTAFVRNTLDGGAIVTLTVENSGNASAEVPVTVIAGREEASQRLLVRAKSSGVVRIRVLQTPTSARVNDGSVPETNMENNDYSFPASTN